MHPKFQLPQPASVRAPPDQPVCWEAALFPEVLQKVHSASLSTGVSCGKVLGKGLTWYILGTAAITVSSSYLAGRRAVGTEAQPYPGHLRSRKVRKQSGWPGACSKTGLRFLGRKFPAPGEEVSAQLQVGRGQWGSFLEQQSCIFSGSSALG